MQVHYNRWSYIKWATFTCKMHAGMMCTNSRHCYTNWSQLISLCWRKWMCAVKKCKFLTCTSIETQYNTTVIHLNKWLFMKSNPSSLYAFAYRHVTCVLLRFICIISRLKVTARWNGKPSLSLFFGNLWILPIRGRMLPVCGVTMTLLGSSAPLIHTVLP